ncbi:carbohydrate ABC transporter permease [Niallia taxi]|uniref:carbohydrate ABC transporter permease n=1 Tax=Niallia taxi TaxID=2499688 RepID=UPI00254E7E9B|nr:carbohydrate ABC transporter permease [Niallia taxi]MDK8642176.1 carbohydrate ABC transporter permease [Niallia taxi]MED4041132.1 carbohydrate ABC transporter permease [Niallia taxi]
MIRKRNKGSLRESKGDRVFSYVNTIIMILVIIACFYPIWYVIVASFSSSAAINANIGKLIFPQDFTLGAYSKALSHPLIISGFRNIFLMLLISLPINMLMTILCGYFMASKNVMWKNAIVSFFMFTMFFHGGLIPSFLNQKELGLYNNIWALIIPGALSLFNAIICKSAIEGIPDSLVESAKIDGAGDITILGKILVPVIKPTLAVLLLYYGVGLWNNWFNASIYITDNDLLPIQNILRAVLLANNASLNQGAASADVVNQYAETIKYAAICISTIPILCIYPFLQKYFVKGVMIGSVKG